MRPSGMNIPFNSRIGQQPHQCDKNIAGAGDPGPNESKRNRDGVDADARDPLSVPSDRNRKC
jgi:hypothetical protein